MDLEKSANNINFKLFQLLSLYLHCHRLSLDEPILDQHGSYID